MNAENINSYGDWMYVLGAYSPDLFLVILSLVTTLAISFGPLLLRQPKDELNDEIDHIVAAVLQSMK